MRQLSTMEEYDNKLIIVIRPTWNSYCSILLQY